METESDGVPSYLQPDKEPDLDAELNLPSAPMGHAEPGGRSNAQVQYKCHSLVMEGNPIFYFIIIYFSFFGNASNVRFLCKFFNRNNLFLQSSSD